MKRFALIFTLLLAATTLPLRAQNPGSETPRGVYRVNADALASYLRDTLRLPVYFVRDTADKFNYTIEKEGDAFREEAFAKLRANGYTVTDYDGKWFVFRGSDFVKTLPAGYFENRRTTEETQVVYGDDAAQVTTFQNKIYEIGEKNNARGGRAFVRGTVRDAASGEPVTGVSVYTEGGAYALTDASGLYRIQLPVGDVTLSFSGYSMEDMTFHLKVYGDGALDVSMKEKVFALTGATVTAESAVRHRTAQMGIEIVRINAIKKVPVAFGESDVLKVVMTLPGVKSVGEVSNGFNVRGGSTDQNLILFNQSTLYNPSHMFGLLSAFNSDVINDVELYKSSIPVEYGGRISSVLEVRSRDGNSNKVTGSLGLGLLTSRAHLEGPLDKEGKTTFILGGRMTYSNWMLRLLPEGNGYNDGTADFGDVNVGITHKINDRNSIHACGYYSHDRFSFSPDTSFLYNNLNGSLKWRSSFGERHSLVLSAGYDTYDYAITDTFNPETAYRLSTGIRQAFLKSVFKTVLSSNHTLTYGISATHYDLRPGSYLPNGDASIVNPNVLDPERAVESAVYAGDQWTLSDAASFDAGLRYVNYYKYGAHSKMYHAPEVRIAGKYSFTDHLTAKAGFNTMTQFIHKISNCVNISPNDNWKMSDADVLPQRGWQAASGLYATVAGGTVELSAEVYYKQVKNFIDYKSGAILEMNPNLSDELIRTLCRAWGVEVMARRNIGKLNGWVSYTWSRSLQREMEDRGSATINRGEWYNSSHDKPHDFKMVANYRFTHRISLSANMDYSTGRPVTVPIGKYWYSGSWRLLYSDRNSYRIPDYFRLDLAMSIEPSHYLKQFAHMSLTFGVYNVTGRHNAYSVYYTNENGKIKGHMMSVFATQIPYVNLNLKLR